MTTISETIGKAADRSGADGITADHIEAFYTALADYAAWTDAGTKDVFPFGDKTADALAACEALKYKVADYFMRCKLIGFDAATAPAVDVSVDKIGAIEGNLALAASAIGEEPLAKPAADGKLPLDAVNPAWKAAVEAMRALVLEADKKEITEAEWNEILGKFAPYTTWMAGKKGTEVEGLGIDKVREILKAGQKDALLKLVEADKALEEEALSIEAVDKLLRLYHNFYDYLNNYVVLADFYDPDRKAIFQAGRLYIDQRSTDLCIRVDGPNPDISSLSGMYILYCACKSEKMGKAMNIAAVLTKGDVDGLRPGKNAVFYDRDGNDWSAVVTSIVENPLSLRQAFWAPYKKAARWISDKINKTASDKAAKGDSTLSTITQSATEKPAAGAEAATKAAPFDVGKIAGITIAIAAVMGVVTAIVAKDDNNHKVGGTVADADAEDNPGTDVREHATGLVSSSPLTRKDGSSLASLFRAAERASRSALVLGSMATSMTGSGMFRDSRMIWRFSSQSVSPVEAFFRPTSATMSPAPAHLMSTRLLACICRMRPMRSRLPVLAS